MPRGPLPNPNARRTNAPTIPTSLLPAEGRKGRIPKCPYALGPAGAKWWRHAWRLPQATRWDDGSIYTVARRAMLEDELAAVDAVQTPDLVEIFQAGDEVEAAERLEWMLRKLTARASGTTTMMREMRELDNRLGLNPKALADLRWTIGDVEQPADEKTVPATVRRLRPVDPKAVAS